MTNNNQDGGAIDMGINWNNKVLPNIPMKIECPICDKVMKKENLDYDVNTFNYEVKFPNRIRVRSYKLPSRRRFFKGSMATEMLSDGLISDDMTPTIFYFNCRRCSFIFDYKNKYSEKKTNKE